MPEFDIEYPHANSPRVVNPNIRNIRSRLLAFELDEAYYDGTRAQGYGGFHYDGRWKKMLPKIINHYQLNADSAVLDLGCKKGFFMQDLTDLVPGIQVKGIENHIYPIQQAMPAMQTHISLAEYQALPFADNSFDFVFGFAAIYMLNLRGVVQALREIQRVSKRTSLITLGAYRTAQERELLLAWTLLGTTILHVDEWLEVFAYSGYSGDYQFVTAESLHLVAAKEPESLPENACLESQHD